MPSDPTEYTIEMQAGGTDSVAVGGTPVNISGTNWALVNPFDVTWKYNESSVPEGEGVQPLTDNLMNASTVMLTTTLYGADPDDLQTAISGLNGRLHRARGSRPYLKISLWNGAALITSRRYIDILNSTFPMQPRTLLQATGVCNLTVRAIDPGLYRDTVVLDTSTVVGGADTNIISTVGNVPTKRVTYKIIKDGTDNPTNVTLTTTKGAFTITGSLVNANDYWLIDVYEHTVVKSVSSVVTDDIGNFSGQFPGLDDNGDVVIIAETTAADFKVETRYLNREQ